MSREVMGPALPPGFESAPREESKDQLQEVAGPALPPGYKHHHSSETSDSEEENPFPAQKEANSYSKEELDSPSKRRKQVCEEEELDDGFFGPALPPGFKRRADSPGRPIIGPALPPGFKVDEASDEEEENTRPSVLSAFTKKAVDSSEEEEAEIGPMPAKGVVESFLAREFEQRAQRMKEKLTSKEDGGSKQLKRESWMTELPPELKGFGLGPRTFKRKADEKSGDRSAWTDTPADKEKKTKERQEAKTSASKSEEESCLSERDKKMAEQVSSYNDSKRSESLMDLHQKKLKRKGDDEKSKLQERRPFDRDQDLQVNRFDEAQKKALLKKSKELNSKFSHGKGSMFL